MIENRATLIDDGKVLRWDYSAPLPAPPPSLVRDGIVRLEGDIGHDKPFSADNVRRALVELADAPEVHVEINSAGGNVNEALRAYVVLRECRKRTVVHIPVLAASAATLVAMAADHVEIGPDAEFQIHGAIVDAITGANAATLRSWIDWLDRTDGTIIDVYMRRARCSRGKLEQLMKGQHVYVGREAVQIGFADKVTAPAGSPWR